MKVNISVTLDHDLWKKAKGLGENLSGLINQLLSQHFAEELHSLRSPEDVKADIEERLKGIDFEKAKMEKLAEFQARIKKKFAELDKKNEKSKDM